MKADYERQISSISDVLERLTAERAELANGVDSEHPALVAFKKHQNIETLNRENGRNWQTALTASIRRWWPLRNIRTLKRSTGKSSLIL